jgi:glycosyltransferase involved in cell wall biosynthesis
LIEDLEDREGLYFLILGRPVEEGSDQEYGWETITAAAGDMVRSDEFRYAVLDRFRRHGTLPHEGLPHAAFVKALDLANRGGLVCISPTVFGSASIPIAELERFEDLEFVDEVHLTLLARAPHPAEIDSYIRPLRRGTLGKHELIKGILQSEEYSRLGRPLTVLSDREVPILVARPAIGAALSWKYLLCRVFRSPVLDTVLVQHYGPAAESFLHSLACSFRLWAGEDAANLIPADERRCFRGADGGPGSAAHLSSRAARIARVHGRPSDAALPHAERRKHAFTIACINYSAQIRVLYESFRRFHQDWDFTIFLCDRIGGRQLPFGPEVRVVEIEAVAIPNFEEMRQIYDLTEINTAVKPYCFMHVFEICKPDFAIYLDPDICFLSRMEECEELFDDDVEIVLTPHTFEPIEDDDGPNDYQLAIAGIYNLGFCGVRNSDEGRRFVAWWSRKLARDCRIDTQNGIFVDQKWCDAVPALFDRVHVLRHAGYNAAYWNLMHRPLSQRGNGKWYAASQPLRFFHFSGLEMSQACGISEHQDRYNLYGVNADTRELFTDYRYTLIACEYGRYSREPYLLGLPGAPFRDPGLQASFGRAFQALMEALGTPERRPSDADLDAFRIAGWRGQIGGICLADFYHVIHEMREDVREAYPDLGSEASARGFLDWMRNSFFHEMPVREAAADRLAAGLDAMELTIGVATGEIINSETVPAKYQQLLHGSGLTVPQIYRIAKSFSAPAAFALRRRSADDAPLPLFLAALHAMRTEMRCSFDIETPEGRLRLLRWFMTSFEQEYGPSRLTPDLAKAVERQGPSWADRFPSPAPARLTALRPCWSVEQRAGAKLFGEGRRDTDSFAMSAALANTSPGPSFQPGVSLIGYPRAQMGMGEHVRNTAVALQGTPIPFDIFDFRLNYSGPADDHSCDHLLTTHPRHTVNILCINADETLIAHEVLGPSLLAGRYNIGYWAWELEIFPEAWCPAIDLMDELWAPSRFIQRALRRRASKPVIHMPLRVEIPAIKPFEAATYHVDPRRFSFLFYFDFHSYHQRKNPMAVIEAFRTAFPSGSGDEVALIIKTLNSASEPELRRQLHELSAKDDRIGLVEDVFDAASMAGLVDFASCFVSLHRSEGFGRGMAEAMALGKPVIATRYSGNLDFMDDENSYLVDCTLIPVPADAYLYPEGARWADPDIDHAAKLMRMVYRDPADAGRRAAAAQYRLRSRHSAAAVGQRLYARLREIERIYGVEIGEPGNRGPAIPRLQAIAD